MTFDLLKEVTALYQSIADRHGLAIAPISSSAVGLVGSDFVFEISYTRDGSYFRYYDFRHSPPKPYDILRFIFTKRSHLVPTQPANPRDPDFYRRLKSSLERVESYLEQAVADVLDGDRSWQESAEADDLLPTSEVATLMPLLQFRQFRGHST